MKIFISLIGILVVLGLMFLLSSNKKEIPYKTVIKALGIQFVIAFLLVKFPLGRLVVPCSVRSLPHAFLL